MEYIKGIWKHLKRKRGVKEQNPACQPFREFKNTDTLLYCFPKISLLSFPLFLIYFTYLFFLYSFKQLHLKSKLSYIWQL